jgi:nitrogen regulatory protein PII
MKKIEAFIKPEELAQVQRALEEAGFFSACVMEAGVFVGGGGRAEVTTDIPLDPRLKLELFVEDHEAPRVSMMLAKTVASDNTDRSRIFATATEESVRYYPEK